MDLGNLLGQALGGGTGGQGGGGVASLLPAVLEMLQGQQGGGLQGLVNSLSEKGLGNVVQSWVGTGSNLPVSAEQLQGALGHGTLQDLAAKTGLSMESVGPLLASVLPMVVDKMTPEGRVTPGATQNVGIGDLLGSLGSLFGTR